MKKEENIKESFGWKLFSAPPLAAFVFALASMVFSNDFMGALLAGRLGLLICLVLSAWFGLYIFWALVVTVFSAFIENKKQLVEKLGKWINLVAAGFSVIVFAVLFYVFHFLRP